jgi:hypothetical protein
MVDNSEDTMRKRVLKIIRSPTTKKIDFRLGQWRINTTSFERVANAIEVGDIQVRIEPITDAQGRPIKNAQASYDFDKDTLFFPNAGYGMETFGEAGIVHECVHGFVDLQALSGQTDSANEAAGYVAYMLYLLYSLKTVPTPALDFATIALTIARSIMNTPGAVVSPGDELEFRKAIARDPTYRVNQRMTLTKPDGANGLFRRDLMVP